MKKSYILFSALAFTTVFIASCSKAVIAEDDNVVITEKVTYANQIQPILNDYCNSCHNSASPSAGLALDSYSLAKDATKNGTVIARINDSTNPMPKSGLMSVEKRALFDKWVADGFLEK